MDLVSWNIIFNDLKDIVSAKHEDFINTRDYKSSDTIKDWSNYLQKIADNYQQDEVSYWQSQLKQTQQLPSDFKTQNQEYSESSIFTISTKLEKELTKNLVFETNKTYNTKIEDILIAALVSTICNWSNLNHITLGLERQGRTIRGLDIDLENTVGWFTSFFPLSLKYDNNTETSQLIKSVKEQLRSIPNNGIGFGVLKYLKKMPSLEKFHSKIVFNYLGNTSASRSNEKLNFEFVKESIARHPESERNYEIEVNTQIINDSLIMKWSFTKDLYEEKTAQLISNKFIETLKEIIEHCKTADDVSYTPSDFSEVDLNQDDLDNLLSQF